MNSSKLLYTATVAVALLGSGAAFASEATQFEVPSGQVTRAEVKNELKRAQAAGELNGVTATYGGFHHIQGSDRSRAEVKAEALAEARSRRVASHYIGG